MNTLFIGQKIVRVNQTDSTNNELKKKIESISPPEGFTIVASYQTLGRGQFGNTWESRPYENLLLSLYLKPNFVSASESFFLSMSVCLAIHDVLVEYDSEFLIKWPNDIIRNGRKYCGVLIENQVMGKNIESSIIGMGINLNQKDFGEQNADCLAAVVGYEVDQIEFEKDLFAHLEKRYLQLKQPNGYATVKNEYLSRLYGYGYEVPILRKGQELLMRITDVDAQGRISMIGADQHQYDFRFKEIKFVL